MKAAALNSINLDGVCAICLSGTWFNATAVKWVPDMGIVYAKTPDGSEDREPTMIIAPEAIDAFAWNVVVPTHR